MLAGRIADELIEPRHITAQEPGCASIIRHPDEDGPTLGVGKGGHLSGQRIDIVHIGFELTRTVFTERNGSE